VDSPAKKCPTSFKGLLVIRYWLLDLGLRVFCNFSGDEKENTWNTRAKLHWNDECRMSIDE
jgi:hypothetical protein